MTILVTGGAGYIGSHVVQELISSDYEVVVFDDLSHGCASCVPSEVSFVQASLLNQQAIQHCFQQAHITHVIHLAGYKFASESVQRPLHTYQQNVVATANLLQSMQTANVQNLVFSSSAAVYGTPLTDTVTEETPVSPESPYGESKLIAEWLIKSQAVAIPLNYTSLRYFNVAGMGSKGCPDRSPYNLFPRVKQALDTGSNLVLFGNQYSTPDGTCIRDYIHVSDIAKAHVLALEQLQTLKPVYNLGTGTGSSVLEVFQTFREISGIDFEIDIQPEREGDPTKIVASADAAQRDFDWLPVYSLRDMVSSVWHQGSTSAPRM